MTYKVGIYIYESESIAIRNRKILDYGSEHRKATCTARITQECYGTGTGIGTGTETKLQTGILRVILVIPEFEHGTKFWVSQESV